MTVTGRDRENNLVNRFADTQADGSYLITDLLASDSTGYTVTESQPRGWFDGSDASSVHGTVGNDVVTVAVLSPRRADAGGSLRRTRPGCRRRVASGTTSTAFRTLMNRRCGASG